MTKHTRALSLGVGKFLRTLSRAGSRFSPVIEWRGHMWAFRSFQASNVASVCSHSASFVRHRTNSHWIKRGILRTRAPETAKCVWACVCVCCVCRFLQSGAEAVDACTWHQWGNGPKNSNGIHQTHMLSEWLSVLSSSPVIMWMAETHPWRIS